MRRPGVRPGLGRGRQLRLGAAARVRRVRRLADQRRLPRPRLVVAARAARGGAGAPAARAASRSTRTWARTRARSTPRCASPRSTTSRSRSTPTGSTSACRSRTRWRCSTAAPSTPTTSRAAAAGTRPTCCELAGRAERHRLVDQPDRSRSAATRVAEHEAMIVAVHALSRDCPATPRSRATACAPATMGAEDVLHDLGRHRDHVVRRAGHGPRGRDRAPHVRAWRRR